MNRNGDGTSLVGYKVSAFCHCDGEWFRQLGMGTPLLYQRFLTYRSSRENLMDHELYDGAAL